MTDDRPRLAVRLRSRAPVPRPRDDAAERPYAWQWWKVYDCGARAGTVHTLAGDVASGQACGTPGCWSCDRKRLGKVVAPARVWARGANTQWDLYTFTLGGRDAGGAAVGAPCATPGELDAILDRWRSTMLSAVRAGLWAGGSWVCEVVPLRGGGRSSIPCPYRVAPPAQEPCHCVNEGGDTATCHDCRGSGKLRGAVGAAVAAHVQCIAGACALCRNTGFLPMGHVHVHALVLGRPCWYGDPTDAVQDATHGDRATREAWHRCPGGRGLVRWAAARGWGRVHRAEAVEADRTSAYIGKAAGSYAAKGAPDVAGAFYSQAYLRSGRAARQVFAANFGCLYGLRARTADPSCLGFSVGEPLHPVELADVRAEAVLRAVPRVVVVEGAPQASAQAWRARAEVGAGGEALCAITGPVIETVALNGNKGAQPRSPGGGAGSPSNSSGDGAECGRPRSMPYPGGPCSFPQSGCSGTGAPMLGHGRVAPEGAEPRPARESRGPVRSDVSSSTGANYDSGSLPPLGVPEAGEGAAAPPAEAPAALLVEGPFLQSAHVAEWWEPWVLSCGLDGLTPWWVGGCAASCRAFETRQHAQAFADSAALSRILGVLDHERQGRLARRDDGAGTAALSSWVFSEATRASFGAAWHVDMASDILKHARESSISATRGQGERLAICADILRAVRRGG